MTVGETEKFTQTGLEDKQFHVKRGTKKNWLGTDLFTMTGKDMDLGQNLFWQAYELRKEILFGCMHLYFKSSFFMQKQYCLLVAVFF